MDEGGDKLEVTTSKSQAILIEQQLLSSKLSPNDQIYCDNFTLSSPKDDTNRCIYIPIKYLNTIKRTQTNFMSIFLTIILVTCFLVSIIYILSLDRDVNTVGKTETTYIIQTSNKENQTLDFDYKDINEDTLKMIYSFLPDDQIKNRYKRETIMSLETCQETATNCETILQVTNKFLESLSKNEQFSMISLKNRNSDINDQESKNSMLLEIIKCLECKIVENENDDDDSMSNEIDLHYQHDEYKDFQIIIDLLEGKYNLMEENNRIKSPNVGLRKSENILKINMASNYETKSSFDQNKEDNLNQTNDDFVKTQINETKISLTKSQINLPVEVVQKPNQVDINPINNWDINNPKCFYGYPPSSQSDKNLNSLTITYSSGPYPPIPILSSNNQQSSNYQQTHAQNMEIFNRPENTIPWTPVTTQKNLLSESDKTLPYYCTYFPLPSSYSQNNPIVSDQRNTKESFRNDYKIEHQRFCSDDDFFCIPTKECLPNTSFCDGYVDCSDGSDEKNCTCKDRIPKNRLCDGYIDCPKGEDELTCANCPEDYFGCYNSNDGNITYRCIPFYKRCDGVENCLNGKDEQDCTLLLPEYVNHIETYLVGYNEGYLHTNYRGIWYPLASEEPTLAEEACKNELKLKRIYKPMLESRKGTIDNYLGNFLTFVNNKVKIIDYFTKGIYVKCPPYPCGAPLRSQFRSSNYEQLSTNLTNSIEEDTILGIVGGRASAPEAWPYLIALYKDGNFHCGGVIVNEYWVLTAAHCLAQKRHFYEIQAGILRRSSFSPMTQSRVVKIIIKHPEYNPILMRNDVAMIKIDPPFRFNRWVRHACFPQPKLSDSIWDPLPAEDTICMILGWGALREDGPDTDQLREVTIPILSSCSDSIYDIKTEICAGYPSGGRDACQGDSGGPLLCKNPQRDLTYYVAGIVSHGEGCGRPGKPGIYARVSHFLDFIKSVSEGRTENDNLEMPLVKCPGFNCNDGKCLPIHQRCDRKIHCLNGEDEENCDPLFYSRLINNSRNKSDFKDNEMHKIPIDVSKIKEMIDDDSSIDVPIDEDSNPFFSKPNSTSIGTENSNSSVFTCKVVLQTIHASKRCDKIIDCEDGTDEINCTCKDILSLYRPEAICDGFVDCEDKTDETNCNLCSKNQYLCSKSKTCIRLSKKCDSNPDCPLKEDEMDCLALSNGEYVDMDHDDKPILYGDGILTRIRHRKVQPSCHVPLVFNGVPASELIASHMCHYFGFQDFKTVEEMTVLNKNIGRNVVNETDITYYRPIPTYEEPMIFVNGFITPTCIGLNIRCKLVPNFGLDRYTHFDPVTKSNTYNWPWLAAIFVDGIYRCSGMILEPNWVLSSSECTKNISLSKNYTTVLMGHSPSFLYVDGPYQQISIVDDIKVLNNTGGSLIHLKTSANMTRHVQALFFEKKIYPPKTTDICVAVGTDNDFKIHTAILKPVLKNCRNCHRCYVNDPSNNFCKGNKTSDNDWNGVVFCLGVKGWHPSAVFHEKNSPCSFQHKKGVMSIDSMNSYLTLAMEDKIKPTYEVPICDGIRCKTGQCIPWNQTCDGIQDCRDGYDENPTNCQKLKGRSGQNFNECTKSEMRCGDGECILKSAYCDGIPDCKDKSDEVPNCSCADFFKLTSPERICDGIRNCLDKTDESPMKCPCRIDSYICPGSFYNEICIPQDHLCDGENDCPGAEDEDNCTKIQQFDKYIPNIGEVIQRSFGFWHSKCYTNPITTNEDASKICKSLGYKSGTIELIRNNTAAPMVPVFDDFYIVRMNNQTWHTIRSKKPIIKLEIPKEPCNRAFVSCK